MTPTDAVIWIGTGATLVCAFYAVLGYYRPVGAATADVAGPRAGDLPAAKRHPWVPIICAGLVWVAVGLDYFTRPNLPAVEIPIYGAQGDQFYAGVQFKNWHDHEQQKVILIARTVFSDIDRMTDTWIAKSSSYTLTGPVLSMVAINKMQMHFGVGVANLVELNVAVIPPDISPDQIRNLSDIVHLGGQILGVASVGGIMGVAVAPPQASPSPATPQTPPQAPQSKPGKS
jgi:hypothetical protein